MYATRPLIARFAHRLRQKGAFAWVAWRGFWLVMLLGHAPALLAAAVGLVSDGAGLVRLAFLGGSCLLFALKLADVAWLRLPSGRRTIMSIAAVVALLHAGVLLRTVHIDVADVSIPLVTQVTGAALTLGLLALALRRDRSAGASAPAPKRFTAWSHVLARLAATLLVPRFLCLARSALADRAPPR